MMNRKTLLTIVAISLPLLSLNFGCHAGRLPGPGSDFDSTDLLHCLPEDSVYSFGALNLQWAPAKDGCGNTVSTVLKARSLEPVVYKDAKTCEVQSGLWIDDNNGDTLRLATDLVMDHVVPLPEAYNAGGWAWSHEQWLTFYNDTANIELLSVTSAASKNERTIASWTPSNGLLPTHYVYLYRSAKVRYGLYATVAENDFLRTFGDTIALVDYDCPTL